MSVLRFILFSFFLHIHKYIVRVLLDCFLSFSVCFSLLQANLTREIKANILVERARARSFLSPSSKFSQRARLRSRSHVGTAYFDCLLHRRLFLSSSNTDGSSSRRFS